MTREELINDIARQRKAHDRYHIKLDIKYALVSMVIVVAMLFAMLGAYYVVVSL